jgi:hypothetical protein
MFCKMTIFSTKIIITHVAVDWVVLRLFTTAAACRSPIHSYFTTSYELKFKGSPAATILVPTPIGWCFLSLKIHLSNVIACLIS